MADIQLRFNKDMLVLSSPVDVQLRSDGLDFERDNELMLLLEPEILHEFYALEVAVGAQCIVADTANLTPARLAHSRCKASATEIAEAAIAVVSELNPQHVLVELAPCGLPLDASSADSLNENRQQYERAARAFSHLESQFDAYFLNKFVDTTDLKCALMGLRKVTDKPIFASVDLAGVANEALTLGGKGRETLRDAASVMAEYGAQVAGFSVNSELKVVQNLVDEIKATCMLPVMVQLGVNKVDVDQKAPTSENPYYDAETMVDAAEFLQAAGVQFLRAVGNATPSYTGALVAATLGEDVALVAASEAEAVAVEEQDLEELAKKLRERLDSALNN